MQRRSGFLTFLTSLIPGIGYMYLGLMNKGLEILIIFLLARPVFEFIGLDFIGWIFSISIWAYTFFDTFHVANRIDRGEKIDDTGKIFNLFTTNKNNNGNVDYSNDSKSFDIKFKKINDKKTLQIIGGVLIVIGALAILDNILVESQLYYVIISSIREYFMPVLLLLIGIYMLYKNRK